MIRDIGISLEEQIKCAKEKLANYKDLEDLVGYQIQLHKVIELQDQHIEQLKNQMQPQLKKAA